MDQSSIDHIVGIIIDKTNIDEINKQTFLNLEQKDPNVKISYIKFSRIERGMKQERLPQFINDNYFSSIYFLELPTDLFANLDLQYRDEINQLKDQIQYLKGNLQEKKKEIIIRNQKIDHQIDDLTSIVTQINNSQDSVTINNLLNQNDEDQENDLIEQISELEKNESRYQGSEESQNYGIYQELIYEQIEKHKSELFIKSDKHQKRLLKALLYALKVYMESQNKLQQKQNLKNLNIFKF